MNGKPNRIVSYKAPRRCEIWLAIDRNRKLGKKTQKSENNKEEQYNGSVQGGTRLCIIVSNNMNNTHSPVVEVVYVTTQEKADLPTHFTVESTPRPSTVLCEQVMSVPKRDLTKYYGELTMKEKCQLDKCLKVSLGL